MPQIKRDSLYSPNRLVTTSDIIWIYSATSVTPPPPPMQIVEVSLRMLSHDPNYNYDTDEEEEVEDSMETEGFDE